MEDNVLDPGEGDGLGRIPLEEIYERTAELWARRATCCRGRVGAVLVRDERIIASGFNGAPQGSPHCSDPGVGCKIQVRDGRESCVRTLHCEDALISYCARRSISTEGADLWITMLPCYDCGKRLINAGIRGVYYRDWYTGANGLDMMRHAGIRVASWDDVRALGYAAVVYGDRTP